MFSYSSLSPFDLPVQELSIAAQAAAPFFFPMAEGSTPGTTLNGFLGEALLHRGCELGYNQSVLCLEKQSKPPACPGCLLPGIYKPHPHARPIRLKFDIPPEDSRFFRLKAILWGRRAAEAWPAVLKALDYMREQGFRIIADRHVPFEILRVSQDFSGPLKELIEVKYEQTRTKNRVLLEFVTPFIYRETIEPGFQATLATGIFPLAKVLGNTANDLIKWDMIDRGQSKILDKRTVDDLADRGRAMAEEHARQLTIEKSILTPVEIGSRISRRTKTKRNLEGFLGYAVVKGDLGPVLPWLEVLARWGGGKEKANGFGEVGLWFDPD